MALRQARLGTVVPATGVVTPIGNISSLQELFEVGPEVVRIAYAASDSRLYAALGSPDLSIRGIAEMNPTTGAMTNIGSPLWLVHHRLPGLRREAG